MVMKHLTGITVVGCSTGAATHHTNIHHAAPPLVMGHTSSLKRKLLYEHH